MRTKPLIAMLMVLFLAPLVAQAQDRPAPPPSRPPDKPQPQPQAAQPPPAWHPPRANPVSGIWKAEDVSFPPWTVTLAIEGTKVTGTVSQGAINLVRGKRTDMTGPVEIYDGSIDGNTLSFKCKSPDFSQRTISFTGTIAGDEITFSRKVNVREDRDHGDDGIFDAAGAARFTARRAQQPREAQPTDSQPPEPQPPESRPPESQPSDRQPAKPAPAPPPPDPSPKNPAKDASSSPTPPSGASDTNYDPFHAAQDMEVGKFYMHKGDSDAAIDRFKHAITMKPNFAEPRMYLGELYEKKGDTALAIRYYKEFLQILPEGPDSKKVRKRLEKLTKG